MKLLLIVIILLAIAFAGIAIKMFFIKGAGFVKQCSSIDPKTNRPIGCVCDKVKPGEVCENYEKHHGANSTGEYDH